MQLDFTQNIKLNSYDLQSIPIIYMIRYTKHDTRTRKPLLSTRTSTKILLLTGRAVTNEFIYIFFLLNGLCTSPCI